jgi:alkanesulfonate monooxygenase SsuD/methylene tetrahydromethanopterin reductase-like flavin-dependent oxidoreductase (luciferase family)
VTGLQVGLGLWSMRSSAYMPKSWTTLYEEFLADARLAEDLGYDSLWVAEHHFWYDGWCPQPLIAAAAALGATSRLRIGTGMYLLPQHDPETVSRDVTTLLECFGDRLDLGVALGYRDEEYDAVGVARSSRGKLMASNLDRLLHDNSARWGTPPPIYVGGIADPAIRRAGRRGLSLLLPNSLADREVVARRRIAAEEAAAAGLQAGRTGMLIDVWVTDDRRFAERFREHLVVNYREYAGAWFKLQGEPGFRRPDLLDRQSARTRSTAVIGSAGYVRDRLIELRDLGVDTLVLQVRGDARPELYRGMMAALAQDVVPALRQVA